MNLWAPGAAHCVVVLSRECGVSRPLISYPNVELRVESTGQLMTNVLVWRGSCGCAARHQMGSDWVLGGTSTWRIQQPGAALVGEGSTRFRPGV
jgi:hypothetical protein